jgi:hypothetical protein
METYRGFWRAKNPGMCPGRGAGIVEGDGLVAAGADADGRDAGSAQLLQPGYVGAGVGGQFGEGAALRQVLPPAG